MLDWETFQGAYLQKRRTATIKWRTSPLSFVRTTEAGNTLTLRVLAPGSQVIPPSPMARIRLTEHVDERGRFVDATVSDPEIFREFFHFIPTLLDQLQDGPDLLGALLSTLRIWNGFLASSDRLSDEDEVGLAGECWFARDLAKQIGISRTIDGWAGPLDQPHDFRLKGADVEVKTTTNPARTHLISSLKQLAPVPQTPLFLLSIQLEPVEGSGETLGQLLNSLETLADTASLRRRLSNLVEQKVGRRHELLAQLTRAFRLRSPPMLIPVDIIPAVTPDVLHRVFGAETARLSEFHYRINVDGLGLPLTAKRSRRLLETPRR